MAASTFERAARRPGPSRRRGRPAGDGGAPRRGLSALLALVVAAGLVLLAIAWVSATHTRPSYDGFGWLVWGRQVIGHSNLNTDGAPSWKPLTFLFTLPYALFGRSQMMLWTVTATAAAFSSAVFAARVAFRIAVGDGTRATPEPGRQDAVAVAGALLGGLFAGAAVLFMDGYSHQVFIATSDPMVVALTLAAIDAHLSRRHRLAFLALLLASFGRPEAWPFLGAYSLWAWRTAPSLRWRLVPSVVLVPAAWFLIPGLTSRSWFVSGKLALRSPDAIHHHQLVGVVDRFLGIYGRPMQIAVLVALGLALLRRDRTSLVLGGAAVVWVAVEIAFAYHGWPAQPRYMMEASAVAVVLVGAMIGTLLGGRWLPTGDRPRRRPDTRASPARFVPALIGAAGVTALLVALAPIASSRVGLLSYQIAKADRAAGRIARLQTAVDRLGGPGRILGCGHPVTEVGFQSTLAWDLGLNVGDVGYKPGREIRSGRALVFFRPLGPGWLVYPIHLGGRRYAACERAMRLNLDSGASLPRLPAAPGLLSRRRAGFDGAGHRRGRRSAVTHGPRSAQRRPRRTSTRPHRRDHRRRRARSRRRARR